MKPVSFKRVGLFAKVSAPETAELVRAVLGVLKAADIEVLVAPEVAGLADGIRPVPGEQLGSRADLVIVVGGDGSMLAAARAIGWASTPITGINLGRLGFLADISPPAVQASLEAILEGRYSIERRMMLRAEVDGHLIGHACNDVVIKRHDGSRLLELDAWINGTWISRTRADGLIVATPTGSTAYALSAGGPILSPGLETFAIVPISPHSLGERPVVASADHGLRLSPRLSREEKAEAVLDGQVIEILNPGSEIHIGRSDHQLTLLHPPGYEYFATLRQKLGWGGRAPQC